MSFFQRPHYTSDITRLLEALHHADPTLEQRQREGRARLWEPEIDPALQKELQAARVPQRAYVYYDNFGA